MIAVSYQHSILATGFSPAVGLQNDLGDASLSTCYNLKQHSLPDPTFPNTGRKSIRQAVKSPYTPHRHARTIPSKPSITVGIHPSPQTPLRTLLPATDHRSIHPSNPIQIANNDSALNHFHVYPPRKIQHRSFSLLTRDGAG